MKWAPPVRKAMPFVLALSLAGLGLIPLEAHDSVAGVLPFVKYARGSQIYQVYVHPAQEKAQLPANGPASAAVVQTACEQQLPLGQAGYRLRPRLVTRLRAAMPALLRGFNRVHARGPIEEKLAVYDFDLLYGDLPVVHAGRTVLVHNGRTVAIRDRNPPASLVRPIFPPETAHPQRAWMAAIRNSWDTLAKLYPGKTPQLTADPREPNARLVLWPDEHGRKTHLAWALTIHSISRTEPYLRRYYISASQPVRILDFEDLIFYQAQAPPPQQQPAPQLFAPLAGKWQLGIAGPTRVPVTDWPTPTTGKNVAPATGTARRARNLTGPTLSSSEGIVLAGSVSGVVTGTMWETSPYSRVVSRPLPGLEITVKRAAGGSTIAYTDASGRYSVAGVSGLANVQTSLTGVACRIYDDSSKSDGSATFSSRVGGGVVDVDFAAGSQDEMKLAQTSAYYAVTQAYDFCRVYLPDRPTKVPQIKTHVNVDDSCNAYYDRSDGTLNFFRSTAGGNDGKSCPNTAYHDVVFHEYGHAVDDELGGILDGGYSEGFGDGLAMLMTRSPFVGQDFYGPGKHLRDSRKVVLWPKVKDGEVHEVGEVYAGFCWELVQQLQTIYPQDRAYEVGKQLIMGAAVQNPKDIPDAVRLSFFVDTQLNPDPRGGQSLHAAQLKAAAQSRQLPVPVDPRNLSSPSVN